MFDRLLIGCGVAVLGISAAQAQNGTIVVQTWGGSLGQSFETNVVAPFEEATGISVQLEYGMAADALAKVRAQQTNPQIDIAMMGQTEAATLWREGLLAPLDPNTIPNLANLSDIAAYHDGEDMFFAGMYGYVLELIYRTDMIDGEISSWNDLWNPDYAGMVMFSSPAILSAHPQIMVARANGGDETNMQPAWDALAELAPNLAAIYRTDAETFNLVASGEVGIGPALMYTTLELQQAGVPVARVTPEEGSPISWDGITLVANGPNPEGAQQFIDFMLSVDVVEAHVNTVATIPGVEGVTLSAELAESLPSTPVERERLLVLDDDVIAEHRADWIAVWDREIVPLMR